MPVSARRSRNRSKVAGSWFVGRHVRGLCVNTCIESAPIVTARSTALSMPPEEETWAPMSTAAYAIRMAVRVRMAPSPTGFLHIGGVRTFLYNWLFARHNGGQNLLRIENTDTSREVAEAVDQIKWSLGWLGIEWDEEPTFQLDRMDDCRRAAEQLVGEGKAYEDEGAIRFRMPDEGTTSWDDVVRGRVEVANETIEDVVLVRSDGRPTYNFASPMEDVWDGITHVIRGDDHISNTPKQIRIIEAVGATPPSYAHVPSIFGEDGKKLSKRHGAVGVEEFRAAAPLVQEKIAKLGEFPEFAGFLFHDVERQELDGGRDVVAAARDALTQLEPFTAESIEAALRGVLETLGLKPRQGFVPIRLAVTGSKVSPGLFESIELLGRDTTLARLSAAAS